MSGILTDVSPLFSHKDQHDDGGQDRAVEQQLEGELTRLQALSLPQLAAEIMRVEFAGEYEPDLSPITPGEYTFVPDNLRSPKLEIPPELAPQLRDLAREGAQLLEHRGLIRVEAHYDGSYFSHGYLSTRAGREALASGTLESILAGP
jgi:hypothetical protein